MVQDELPHACLFSATWHSAEIRRECVAILEAHEDDLASLLYRWVQAPPAAWRYD